MDAPKDISGRLTVVSVMAVEGSSMRFPPCDDEPFEADPGPTGLTGSVISVISGPCGSLKTNGGLEWHDEIWHPIGCSGKLL